MNKPDKNMFRGQHPFRLAIKACWKLGQQCHFLPRLLYHRALVGVFFRRIGSGTRFWGRVRFGSAEGNISLGKRCWIGHDVFLSAARGCEIEIGDDCAFNTGCHTVAVYGIHIGSGTAIGEFVSIRDQNHRLAGASEGVTGTGYTGGAIRIGKGVWIGRGVFIGPNVTLGDYCVIGANSVVTESIPERAVAVGAPAKVVRYLSRDATSNH
jgi:acetyltransferase-like isoleucine patch superfamily enzyme